MAKKRIIDIIFPRGLMTEEGYCTRCIANDWMGKISHKHGAGAKLDFQDIETLARFIVAGVSINKWSWEKCMEMYVAFRGQLNESKHHYPDVGKQAFKTLYEAVQENMQYRYERMAEYGWYYYEHFNSWLNKNVRCYFDAPNDYSATAQWLRLMEGADRHGNYIGKLFCVTWDGSQYKNAKRIPVKRIIADNKTENGQNYQHVWRKYSYVIQSL